MQIKVSCLRYVNSDLKLVKIFYVVDILVVLDH